MPRAGLERRQIAGLKACPTHAGLKACPTYVLTVLTAR